MKKNPHAQALARLGKGIKKTLTLEQRAAKALLMAEARKNRWPAEKGSTDRPSKAGKSSAG